ncbi:MAG: Crp/Fnr family transcriptional regulator [Candidatus Saccharibacteria bacterium]
MFSSTKQNEDLVKVFHGGTKLTYKKGEFVIRPGEAPSGVFFIETGLVKAYNISKYGEENLLIIRRSEELFPLIWAITGQERSIIYQAMDNLVLWRISRKDYLKDIHNDPKMLMPMLEMTLEMYRLHSEHIINLEYRTVRERLISFLLNTSERFGEPGPKKGIILLNVPLKQQDIASSINATRETTSREIVRLERLGLVSANHGKISLLDPNKLRAYL